MKKIIGEKLNELKEGMEYVNKLDVREEDKEKIKAYYNSAQKFFDVEEVMKAKAEIQSGKTKVNEVLKSFCTESNSDTSPPLNLKIACFLSPT